MVKRRKEITKAEYDICVDYDGVPEYIKDKYIESWLYCSYGVYNVGVEEEDGKYYLWFYTGACCD